MSDHYYGENEMQSITSKNGIISYDNCKRAIINNVGIALNGLTYATYEVLQDNITASQFKADCCKEENIEFNPFGNNPFGDGERKEAVKFLADLFEIGNGTSAAAKQYEEVIKYVNPVVKNLTGNTVSVNDHNNLMKVIADAMAALVQYEAEKAVRSNPLFVNPAEMVVRLQKQLADKDIEIEQLKKQLADKYIEIEQLKKQLAAK